MKPISVDSVTHAYKLYAPIYDYIFGAIYHQGRVALWEAIGSLKPKTLLEVGVGTGLMLERYPSDTVIFGIDVSAEMLEIARHRLASLANRSITLSVMNAERMDFPDNHFDCVTLPYVLSVTPDPEALIAEVRRVCKPDGTILIVNHFNGSPFWWFLEQIVKRIADKVGFRSSFSYKEQILKYDWRVVSVKDVNLFNLSKFIAIRNS